MLPLLAKNESQRTDNRSIKHPAELDDAQKRLIHLVQLESFNTEKNCLLKSSPLNWPSKIVYFSPFIGLMVFYIASFDMKRPILLDSRHSIIRLFLENFQSNQCHQGVEYSRASIQQEYTIVKLRPTSRSIVSRCITYRKRKAETLAPMMSDLPRERFT